VEELDERRAARWSGPLAVACAAVACVAVAIAAAGEPLRGARGSTARIRITPWLSLVPIAAFVVLGLVGLAGFRHTDRVRLGHRRSRWITLVALALLLLGALGLLKPRPEPAQEQRPVFDVAPAAPGPVSRHTAWPIWLGVAAGAVLALVAAAASRRRPATRLPRWSDETEAALHVLTESAGDLSSMADPRQAVIAAYARLLDGLQDVGAGRRPAEAPFEYVTRVLGELGVRGAPLERLTTLFAEARFSTHDITESDRIAALDALAEARDDLTKVAA
jgi:hypothetical protein